MAENRFGAECCRCGQWVNAGDGYLLGRKITHKRCVPVVDLSKYERKPRAVGDG